MNDSMRIKIMDVLSSTLYRLELNNEIWYFGHILDHYWRHNAKWIR